MNKPNTNIRRIREQKGYSQDYVASRLGISQASYARLENEDVRITVDRLYKIAEVLDAEILDFFDVEKLSINTQNNYEGSQGYVKNLTIENKQITDKLIASYEERLKEKDEQILYLKELLNSTKK